MSELLASRPYGATKKVLVVAHGFDTDMIAGLVCTGLAAEEREVMKPGGKMIDATSAQRNSSAKPITSGSDRR